MKFYIASKFEDREIVKEYIVKLTNEGHEVSYDWTDHKQAKPYSQHPNISQEHAITDMNGVLDADIFILISSPEKGAGYSSELGAAIAAKELRGKPEVLVLGEHLDLNMFYFHPHVKRYGTIEEIIAYLKTITH